MNHFIKFFKFISRNIIHLAVGGAILFAFQIFAYEFNFSEPSSEPPLVSSFTEPTQSPPAGNAPAPVNVSSTPQDKTGWFTFEGGGTRRDAFFATITGNVGIGTTEPKAKLQVGPQIGAFTPAASIRVVSSMPQAALLLQGDSGGDAPPFVVYNGGGNEIFQITPSGGIKFSDGTIQASAAKAVEMAQAFRSDSCKGCPGINKGDGWGTGVRPITVIFGDSNAFEAIDDVNAYKNSSWWGAKGTPDRLDGIGCASGWRLVGCWISNSVAKDSDMPPYSNGCVTNDFDQTGRYTDISITCMKIK